VKRPENKAGTVNEEEMIAFFHGAIVTLRLILRPQKVRFGPVSCPERFTQNPCSPLTLTLPICNSFFP